MDVVVLVFFGAFGAMHRGLVGTSIPISDYLNMVPPYIFAVCFAFLEIFLGRVPSLTKHKTDRQTESTRREGKVDLISVVVV